MGRIVLKLIGIIIVAVGVVCVYDSRRLSKRFFSSMDINDATEKFKIAGLVVSVIGAVMVL